MDEENQFEEIISEDTELDPNENITENQAEKIPEQDSSDNITDNETKKIQEQDSSDNITDNEAEEIQEQVKKPLPARQGFNRSKTQVAKGPINTLDPIKKRMNMIIFAETIMIFLLIGSVVYLVWGIYTGNLSKHKNAVVENQKLAQQAEELQKKYDEAKKLKITAEKDLSKKQEELDSAKTFVEKANTEIKKLTEAGSPEKFKVELVQKQEEINGLNERLEKATKEYEESSKKLADLEEEYNRLKTELNTAKITKREKQEQIEKIYGEYETKALKSLEELKSINSVLEKGIDVIKFARELDRITPVIEEIKNGSEDYSMLASYHLITAAFDCYKTSLEIWKRLSITYLPEELFDLPKKELQLEAPIKGYRPWVDGMQINWLYAQYYLKSAEAIIKNRITCKIHNVRYVLINLRLLVQNAGLRDNVSFATDMA
jgi:predicted  nucleic acid-binding Zn-ribbon protein